MRPHVFAGAVALVLPLTMQPVEISTADAQGRQQGRQIRFAEMDTNRDGQISRDEWRGSLQSFRVHDWNGDGTLSGDEVAVGGRRPTRDEDFTPGRLEMRDWTVERFGRLDRNRDSRITRDEWIYDMEGFRRADRNRDNVLTRAEFLAENTFDDDREDRFVDLDINGNGRIERREWHGSREGFDWLDRDRNGSLEYAEVVGVEEETAAKPSNLFTSIDVNGNGRIEREEWHWSRGSFSQRDTNSDGVITPNELPAAEPEAVGTTGRTIVVDSTVRWTDTGINVRAGDIVSFIAEGSIQLSTDANDTAEPTGSRTGRRAANSPVNTQLAGGLIAMISGSQPVYVGNRSNRLRVPANGRLYLSVNDDHLGDNRGEFRVNITVSRQ